MIESYKNFLSEQRFPDGSNEHYIFPLSLLPKRSNFLEGSGEYVEDINFEDPAFIKEVTQLISSHENMQVPRLKTLRRYYDADNDIKYLPKKPHGRADNRIASSLAPFAVDFKQGIVVGNAVKYSVQDKTIKEMVDEVSRSINDSYHNQLMTIDMLIYGRAYEIVYNQEIGKVKKLSPYNTFVIYDDTDDMNSICGVNWYTSTFGNKTETHLFIYANDDFVYHFSGKSFLELELIERTQHYFEGVQINEWMNGEDRKSDFERVMDIIDAYDISVSEMANFQQDSSNAYLVIEGNPDTATIDTEGMTEDEASKAMKALNELQETMAHARMLILGDRKVYNDGLETYQGVPPKAYYLVREYDVDGVESHNSRLINDYLRYTSLIDFVKEDIGSNNSGVALRFKGWGSDNDRRVKERIIEKSLMRRWRLLAHIWAKTNNADTDDYYTKINELTIQFTPNIPQSDEEIMRVISGMVGIVSDETIAEMASGLTGVDAKLEMERIAKEGINPATTDAELSFLSRERDVNGNETE